MYDPTKIKVKDEWAVVLAEPRKVELSSGLFLPPSETGVEKVTQGAGTIIRVGEGEKNSRLGLEKGQRILYRTFLKYANPIETDEKWESGVPKEYFIINTKEIMAIIPPDVDVGVFSGRPMVPAKD
jgi:co-chaperonin GroES (HSP10)